MAEAFGRSGSVKQIDYFAFQRISELEREISKAQREKEMWEEIRKQFKPLLCPSCGGKGEVSTRSDPDCSDPEICLVCGGSGEKKKTP